MIFNGSQCNQLNLIYRSALSAVNGRSCVAHYLRDHPIKGDIYLIAIGKAAIEMTNGAFEMLDSQIRQALVITKNVTYGSRRKGVEILESAHPVPDERSLRAGERLLEFISDIPPGARLLCLISGGTSSLVEVLPDNVELRQLRELNTWLLENGLPISEMNAIRKRVSKIKGGRLAGQINAGNVHVLIVSDVKGDMPADIGSGLLFPPTSTDLNINPDNYPAFIAKLINAAPALPKADDVCFSRIQSAIVASLDMAISAAEQYAISRGYDVVVHPAYLEGDAVRAGKNIAKELKKSPEILHIWGGECTVNLPENPGKGGRCQSLALSAVIAMKDFPDWCLLAAGTDGSDATENIAGACVDAETLSRARQIYTRDKVAEEYLKGADAGSFLMQTNDLLVTGPTGTNVTDIVMAISSQPDG